MNERKTVLEDLFDATDTFMGGYWPKEVVEDWRYKKLFDAMEAVARSRLIAKVCMNAHKYVDGIMQPCSECGS